MRNRRILYDLRMTQTADFMVARSEAHDSLTVQYVIKQHCGRKVKNAEL